MTMPLTVIRQSTLNDLDQIFDITQNAGYGMTNLPAIREILEEKISRSQISFDKDVAVPQDEIYFFVMEEIETGKIVGCCGIMAQAGCAKPFYTYKVTQQIRASESLHVAHKNYLLNMVNDYNNLSEVGLLFLLPEYRHHHHGQLLSRSRFLYIADNKHRVTNKIIAEMRGVVDAEGISPFWQAVGEKFVDLSFTQVDSLISQGKQQFIAELMPMAPIHVILLPEEARAVIGKTHTATEPALALLKKEGFEFENYINIFEAGPCLILYVKHGLTINHSVVATIKHVVSHHDGEMCLISTVNKPFRACLGQVSAQDIHDPIRIHTEVARTLQVSSGDMVRYIALGRR